MLVCVLLVEIHIPYARSLKEKRMVVKSLKEKLRNRFEMSVGEVGFQDLHQRSRLAASFIADEHSSADAKLGKIIDFVESNSDAVLAGWTSEKLDFDETVAMK
jgi:uncharacterized protein YlxP (DUF503 family)